MRPNKQEHGCKLIDISVGGAAIQSPVEVEVGERILGTFDIFGAIEGHVVRTFAGGFAIELQATQYKRDKLAAQINELANSNAGAGTVHARRHERFAVANRNEAMLKLDEGVVVPANIINFSMSGALVATNARPPLGQHVQLGKIMARVVRHDDDGIAVEFLSVQPSAQETVQEALT